jgi:6-phosphogluconolactonase (cycloisomerase 2 family)
MSNAAAANQILGFKRATDGKLTPMAAPFATGGKGSGAGLGEQGALAFDRAKNLVYTVNAGDNSFSILPVKDDGTLGAATHVAGPDVDAGGARLLGPKSITFHDNLVYVLFQGDATTPSMISGWTVSSGGGALSAAPIAASTLPLSSATQSVDPAQIEFSPDGKWLVVTEKQSGAAGTVKGDGSIDSFAVGAGGVATKMGFYPTASAGADAGRQMTPFGFEFLGNYLIVSEAGSTGVGSYAYAGGVIAPVAMSQFQSTDPAPCWVAVSSQWAYVTNARGPSISGFAVDAMNGGLGNIGPVANGVVASTGRTVASDAGLVFQGPTDEFVTYDGQFLYVLNSAVPSIGAFRIKNDGTLARVGDADYTATPEALPAGSAGIVAR